MNTDTTRLVHYTAAPETVGSILEDGFLLVPNKRHLINVLLGEELFLTREPQEYGMVSFTQLPLGDSANHRQQFGSFGVVVSWDWALRNDAQRVIYVDQEGRAAEEWAWLFRFALQEFRRADPEAAKPNVLENKAMTSFARSSLWSRLLTMYEYMEPERNSAQVEWRIVNSISPRYDGQTRQAVIAEILRLVMTWHIGSVKVTENDIHALIAPADRIDDLRQHVPKEFSGVPITTYRYRPRAQRLKRLHEQAMQTYRSRERVRIVIAPPPRGAMYLEVASDGAFYLPDVGRINGARLFQDELNRWTQVLVQYESTLGKLCDVIMPVRDALYLLNALRELQYRSGLDPLNPLDEHNRPRQVLVGQMRIGTGPLLPRRRHAG